MNDWPVTYRDGFAIFRNATAGLANLARLLDNYYVHFGLKTPFDVVSRYAPSTENDTLAYVRFIASYVRCPLGKEKTFDMRLQMAWNKIDLMRGIIRFENGTPPRNFAMGGEWFSPNELWIGVELSRR